MDSRNVVTPSGSVRAEVQGGIAIFLAMAYIVVVEPAVLSGRAIGISTGIPATAAKLWGSQQPPLIDRRGERCAARQTPETWP